MVWGADLYAVKPSSFQSLKELLYDILTLDWDKKKSEKSFRIIKFCLKKNTFSAGVIQTVLKYHVAANGQPINTAASQSFTISLTGGAEITDAGERVSSITITDVQFKRHNSFGS